MRLGQVPENLLSNAAKFTKQGDVTLKIWRESTQDGQPWVKVAISDSGIGMTEEQLKLLGTKFFRADHDHVLQQSGTGLGFAITANLIDLMGSEIQIESDLGKGSTFSFDLPVVDQG